MTIQPSWLVYERQWLIWLVYKIYNVSDDQTHDLWTILRYVTMIIVVHNLVYNKACFGQIEGSLGRKMKDMLNVCVWSLIGNI